jgi:hypothetical protein
MTGTPAPWPAWRSQDGRAAQAGAGLRKVPVT